MAASQIKKVLVIGGYGFIGSHLSSYYESEGVEVYKTSRYLKSRVNNSKNGFYSDYSKESFKEILLSHEFDLIYYLSGNPYPAFSEKDPSYDIQHTTIPTINLLNALVEIDFKGAIWFASSVAVYGKTYLPFQAEDDLCQPLSSYGLAKLNAEEYIKLYARNHNIASGAFRVFSTFGEGLKRQIIYDLFQKCNQDSETLELYGSGEEKRDLCYIGDQVLRMTSIAAKVRPDGDIFNIGSGVSYSTQYIAETILKILDSSKKIIYIDPIRKFDGYQWTASMDKFSSIIPNIKPNFEDSLKKTLESYKLELKK